MITSMAQISREPNQCENEAIFAQYKARAAALAKN